MVPFQVILLLLLVSTPATLPASLHWLSAEAAAAFLLSSHAALVLLVFLRTRRALYALHGSSSSTLITAGIDRLFGIARWTTIALTMIALYQSNLPETLHHLIDQTALFSHIPMLAETLFITPALLSWLAFWCASYFIETANRERALPYRLAQGLPAHPMPTMTQFVTMHVRHNFYILAPIALHNAIMAVAHLFVRWVPNIDVIAAPVGIVIVLVTAPWLLAKVWSTVPLTGALRARLDAVAAAHRLRFRNILLWRTHNAVTNAAILGWVPFARYFLMTDALLETLSDRQLEAVFAHEVGHGVHRHITWYLAAMFGVVSLATGAGVFWCLYMPAGVADFAGADATLSIIWMIVVGVFLGVGFPWMSHRFEHQADYFAARHMARLYEENPQLDTTLPAQLVVAESEGGPIASMTTAAEVVTLQQYISGTYPHSAPAKKETIVAAEALRQAPVVPAVRRPTAAEAGTELFISSLDTIIELSHRARNRGGWMHPSVNHRMSLLRALATDTRAAAIFERKMLQTRLVIGVIFVVGIVAGAAGMVAEKRAEQKAAATAPSTVPHTAPNRAGH